jgi:hypothetical protein
MTIFLILAPYGAFGSLLLLTSAKVSVFVAAAICLAVIALDFVRGRSLKWLGAGSAVVFVAIGLYLTLIDPTLDNSAVKLSVNIGVFAISLTSMLIRRPFTLQYALEAAPVETAAMPGFLRANYIITGAWTAAALVMMVANLAALYVPGLPIWLGLAIAFAARNSAAYFTKWYPQYRKGKYGTAPAGAVPST